MLGRRALSTLRIVTLSDFWNYILTAWIWTKAFFIVYILLIDIFTPSSFFYMFITKILLIYIYHIHICTYKAYILAPHCGPAPKSASICIIINNYSLNCQRHVSFAAFSQNTPSSRKHTGQRMWWTMQTKETENEEMSACVRSSHFWLTKCNNNNVMWVTRTSSIYDIYTYKCASVCMYVCVWGNHYVIKINENSRLHTVAHSESSISATKDPTYIHAHIYKCIYTYVYIVYW